jgi:formate-dependent nitrite reductase membrane component NrfD
MFEYTVYNIAPWGFEIVAYFFLIGTASMVFVLAAAPNVFGGVTKVMEPFQKKGVLVALAILVICGPLLILDIGQPSRFLYPLVYFHASSPLSWGTLFLPLFGLCIVGFFYGLAFNKPNLLKPLGIIGSLLALSMPLYTGVDLMANQARELWSTPTIPVLFVILSISSGTGLTALVLLFGKGLTPQVTQLLRIILFISVGTTLALFLAEWMVLYYGSKEQQHAGQFIMDEFGVRFWWLTLVVGILIPLVLVALPKLAKDPKMVTLAGVLSAVGAYSFRDVLIHAGQLPQLFF